MRRPTTKQTHHGVLDIGVNAFTIARYPDLAANVSAASKSPLSNLHRIVDGPLDGDEDVDECGKSWTHVSQETPLGNNVENESLG